MSSRIQVILIGGSAGALDALVEIGAALPTSVRVPIVVVLHVSPTAPNLLPAVLQRVVNRPVREADDKERLAENTIYVAPPNYHLLLERDRTIALSVDDLVNFSRPSIDVAFESAVDALDDRLAAVVLSGANTDGSRGLAKIAAAGGLAIVQDPKSAPHRTMPEAAIRAVPGAHVHAIGDIAPALATLTGRT